MITAYDPAEAALSPKDRKHAEKAEALHFAAERLLLRIEVLRNIAAVLLATATQLDETLGAVSENLSPSFEEHGYYGCDWYTVETMDQLKETIYRVEDAWGDIWGRTVADPARLEVCAKQLEAMLHDSDG